MRTGLIITAILCVIALFITSCESEEQVEFQRYYSAGSLVYETSCQNCHGAKGEGLQALIPPLTDSIYLKNNIASLGCSIKYGLKGKLTIAGRQFDGVMPANDLAPMQVAMVLTYVTNSFGNKLGIITSEQVEGYLAKCK